MFNKKILKTIIFSFVILICLLSVGCSTQNFNEEVCYDITQDSVESRISFGKKYYYLSYENYIKDEYYLFNDDGSASYTHVMKNNDVITFHQQINFKWTYSGDGNCILLHNGTKMITGKQDDTFGFSRVMRVSKDIAYWSSSGENTYFICEDFVSQIPNYAKLISNE